MLNEQNIGHWIYSPSLTHNPPECEEGIEMEGAY